MTCPETITIGAYVLGALDVSERRATEQHLETCAACREALLQFAPIPGLLHAVPLEDIESDSVIETPRFPLETTEIHDSAVHGRTKRRLVAAAAVVVLGVAGVLGWLDLRQPAADTRTWTATNGVDGIDTTAALTSRGWGTDIELRMTDLKPGEHCKLIVHGREGTTEIAGWWATTGTYKADVPASTSIPLQDIDRLEVVTAGDTVLSTVSPTSR